MSLKARLNRLEQAKRAKAEHVQQELSTHERVARLSWLIDSGGEDSKARIAALLMDPASGKAGTVPPALMV